MVVVEVVKVDPSFADFLAHPPIDAPFRIVLYRAPEQQAEAFSITRPDAVVQILLVPDLIKVSLIRKAGDVVGKPRLKGGRAGLVKSEMQDQLSLAAEYGSGAAR